MLCTLRLLDRYSEYDGCHRMSWIIETSFDEVAVLGATIQEISSVTLKADSQIECRAHAVPLPCRAVPLRFHNVSIPFDLHSAAVSDSHLPCRAHVMLRPCRYSQGHSTARPCCAVALRRAAWSEHGMASVNQTLPHCVNQMEKTHSKPLAARHGRGTAWARHAMCESAFNCAKVLLCHTC